MTARPLGLWLATILFLWPAIGHAAERAIIVLDGSGSMWGRIGEEPKISIAREVLAEVLAETPADLSVGLLAYGHREEGNCGDIELLVAAVPGQSAAIVEAAQSLNPRGKTPLTEAVRQAAGFLRHDEEKATVILITDGIETCSADPCALARELEASGVDFTTHVVGFGLSAEEGRQVACLADETGGLYIQAKDTDDLKAAFNAAVAEAAAPALPPDEPPAEPPPAEVAALPAATLDAPAQVDMARPFTIAWDGPGERRDSIEIFDPAADAGRGEVVRRRQLANTDIDSRSLQLVAPAEPGTYELRYHYNEARAVIATRAVEVVATAVSLDAPATVDIGGRFAVAWVGPGGQRDSVLLVDPRARQGEGAELRSVRIVNGDMDARTVEMAAPAEPGFYQLQYRSGDDRLVLATREIEVLPAEVGLDAPDTVKIGATFEVAWVGPGGRRDSVEIFDAESGPRAGEVVGSIRIVNGDYDRQTVRMIAPARPGDYTLRYWNGDNRIVLAERQITVEAAEVSLAAAETVPIAHTLEVAWVGPGAQRDSVELYDPAAKAGAGEVLSSQRLINGDYDARSIRIVAPARPGDYVLRYWSADSRIVLAERPLTVTDFEVTLTAPPRVAAGETFTISWVGPGAVRDAVELFDPLARGGEGQVVASKRLVNDDYDGRTARLKAPDRPGAYSIRYWNGDNSAVLAETPITVE